MGKPKAVVILSGGMDSTTVLYHTLKDGYDVHAVGFDYGQRHRKELIAADQIAQRAKVPFKVVDLSVIRELIARGSQTGDEPVPEGHYADESMRKTVVPNRNMIMLAVAVGYAITLGAKRVVYGAHAGDHAIYPDCRPQFVEALAAAVGLCDYETVELVAPFVHLTKTVIARMADRLGVPLQITWSCYKGGDKHCGKCGTCVERREAFAQAQVPDPTEYE